MNQKSEVWIFEFSLESETGDKLKRNTADDLMEKIIEWAEKNHCQIGGGYRKPDKGEFEDKELYPVI